MAKPIRAIKKRLMPKADTIRGSDCLELLPECRRLVLMDETSARMMGGFNLLVADRQDRLYLARLEGENLVLKLGRMPLAEADTSVLTPVSTERAVTWFGRAWRTATERQEGGDISALDVFAEIIAAALRRR